jgi:hypothetical protein
MPMWSTSPPLSAAVSFSSPSSRICASLEGSLLFQIDPLPYRLAVEQTTADLNIAEAQLETRF